MAVLQLLCSFVEIISHVQAAGIIDFVYVDRIFATFASLLFSDSTPDNSIDYILTY